MFYSCFDPKTGLYDYFVDDKNHPINGDLPIPQFPVTTKIGVPAIEAGRKMPSGAKPAGRGWHARGLIVQCGRGPLGAVEGKPAEAWEWVKAGGWKWVVGGLVAVWVVRRV